MGAPKWPKTAPKLPGPVETKLGMLGEVRGVVVGAFGEGSEDLHSLIHHLAISRVRVAVAGPQKGRRGQVPGPAQPSPAQPSPAQPSPGLSVGYKRVISGLSEGYQSVISGLSEGYQWVIRGLSDLITH